MKKLILAALLALAIVASYTDFRCVQDCLDKGYDYNLCVKMCSY